MAKIASGFHLLRDNFGEHNLGLDICNDSEFHEPTEDELNKLHNALMHESAISVASFWASCDGRTFQRAALVQCDGSFKRARALCLKFVAFRCANGWPLRLSIKDVPTALRSGMHVLWPQRLQSRQGHPLLLYNCDRLDVSACTIEEYQKLGCFLMECLLYGDTAFTDRELCNAERHAQGNKSSFSPNINGVVWLVVNAQGFGLSNVKNFTIADMRRGMEMWQEAFPVKLRKVFIAGCGPVMLPMLQAARGLLAPKLRQRIVIVNSEFTNLHKHVSPACLPPALGGTCNMDWREHVDHCCEHLRRKMQTKETCEEKGETFGRDQQILKPPSAHTADESFEENGGKCISIMPTRTRRSEFLISL